MRKNGKSASRKNTIKFPFETERTTDTKLQDEILRVEDVAMMMKRSPSSIYKRLENKTLPGHKDGNCWYVLKSELLGHIRSK